ncbi:MAG TPA: hypothetical protein VNU93_07010 [Verrucomicrobiae bacterium]|nr:hypothetical protein [Verrucomicrobiae bacterium]
MLFMAYCGGKNHADRLGHKPQTVTVKDEPTQVVHIEKDTKLTLDNGQKWKLDEPTRKNIGELKVIVDKAAAQSSPNYHQVATDLQASTDKLIGECRMSGPDHDALHLWLEDYLPALKELHSNNKPIQKTAFRTVQTQVQQFGEYFE